MNAGRETEIVDAFCEWLQAAGWTVEAGGDAADIVAERAGTTLVAEVKGVTTSPGLDVDTAYGQLLRRMTGDPSTRYAVVVPQQIVPHAVRVPEHVRATMDIDLYGVDFEGVVRYHDRSSE